MTVLEGIACAKLNLTLDVVGKRPDGFHDLCMVMQSISLGDRIRLTLTEEGTWSVRSDSGEIPCDESNLAVRAAQKFYQASGIQRPGIIFELDKQTPVCAGMGGGSADAAKVLQLLQTHYDSPLTEQTLYRLAEQTGSDVPFALFGGTALAQEKGQVLSRLPDMPDCPIVICKPDFPVSTPELFRAIDSEEICLRPDTEAMLHALETGSLSAIADCLCNVFEPVVSRSHPEIEEIRSVMCSFGALGARMTGSGPTVFGLFSSEDSASACYSRLKQSWRDTYLVHPVPAE